MKKVILGIIPKEVLKFAISEMQKISSGEIIFVAQDGYLMQVEFNQRRRISDWTENFQKWSGEVLENVEKKISQEFSKLTYGRLVIKIQKGKITQIERTVQSRFTGLDGEGI